MKNVFNHWQIIACITLLMGLAFMSSCDKNFTSINSNPDFVANPDLDYELPYIELTVQDSNYYTEMRNVVAYVGQVYDKYTYPQLISQSEAYMGLHLQWIYEHPLKTLADFINHAQTNPKDINYLCIGRILRVQCFDLLTDAYGDIPYSQANQGYTNRIMQPKYDPQQTIYSNMFTELSGAIAAFDPSQPVPTTSDIVYHGDISKWKKFAYGLMLRLALRIYNVDPADGKKYIDQAIAGGLPQSNDDNFVVYYEPNTATSTTANGIMKVFIASSYVQKWRLAAPFIDSLKFRDDPRLTAYAMIPTAPYTSYHDGDHTYANQIGAQQFGTTPQSLIYYSTVNINTFGSYSAPVVWLSYAEVEFNLAECVVRGIISGDAQTYYNNGVQAAMEELSIYGPDGVITPQQIDAYLQANPYNPANALVMINTQYWIETFGNWYECWANMRRTGIPDVYSGIDQSIQANFGAALPRRLMYPPSEISANPNVQQAISDQGPNTTTTRMWWDKN